MSEPLRKELARVLARWEAGGMTCQAVQNWARATSARGADAFCELAMQHLRNLGEHLITCDDIPTYLECLELPPVEGVAHLKDAGVSFDVKARATDLKNDPFYGPHTKAILRELS